MPLAATVKVADCPAVTVWFAGCVVIVGAIDAGTLLALLLVTNPAQPLKNATAHPRIAEAAAHTNPVAIVFTFFIFVGSASAHQLGVGVGAHKRAAWSCPISAWNIKGNQYCYYWLGEQIWSRLWMRHSTECATLT